MGDRCISSACSQFCIEKGSGDYECACGSAYLLEGDRHGCKLKSKRGFVCLSEHQLTSASDHAVAVVPPVLVSVARDTVRMSSFRDAYQSLSINTSTGRVLAYSTRYLYHIVFLQLSSCLTSKKTQLELPSVPISVVVANIHSDVHLLIIHVQVSFMLLSRQRD